MDSRERESWPGAPPLIDAKCETVDKPPMFRGAYRRRQCILPVDSFFEWKAIEGQKAIRYMLERRDYSP
jgi:putative SOS response-associated peptidase YedK